MTDVSRKRHLKIVFTLGAVIVVLAVALFFAVAFRTTFPSLPFSMNVQHATDTTYLTGEEAVIVTEEKNGVTEEVVVPIEKVLFEYVEVTDSCGPHYEGECLRVRSGPGTEYPDVARLRNGMVLKVGGKVEREDMTWYKIVFDEWLRYPERITTDWYVSANYVKVLLEEGDATIWDKGYVSTPNEKHIVVNRSDQTLAAYDGETLFMQTKISTGLALTPTPRGTFTIYKKTPSRYMQGPLPDIKDKQVYDLPGVPWNLYFTQQGAVIHGAYWHTSFGSRYSHGCVNMSPEDARKLYEWATLGTKVTVQD